MKRYRWVALVSLLTAGAGVACGSVAEPGGPVGEKTGTASAALFTPTAATTAQWTSYFSDQTWSALDKADTIHLADVDGDGVKDICGRSATGVFCALSTKSSFEPATQWDTSFSDANGWNNVVYADTIQFSDVNGDGMADLCGRGYTGVFCALSTGAGFNPPTLWSAAGSGDFSDAAGWGSINYAGSIRLGDINGDKLADVCGRSAFGVLCALSTGTAFAAATPWDGNFTDTPSATNSVGWYPVQYGGTLQLGDIDGDGKADICGRSVGGMYCALSNGVNGFVNDALALDSFSDNNGWDGAQYYSTIRLGDVDGDGKWDICGRGGAGVYCASSTSTPGQVTPSSVVLWDSGVFNDAWAQNDPSIYDTIQLGNIDGNAMGRQSVCGRTGSGITCMISAAPPPPTLVKVVSGVSGVAGCNQALTWQTANAGWDAGWKVKAPCDSTNTTCAFECDATDTTCAFEFRASGYNSAGAGGNCFPGGSPPWGNGDNTRTYTRSLTHTDDTQFWLWGLCPYTSTVLALVNGVNGYSRIDPVDSFVDYYCHWEESSSPAGGSWVQEPTAPPNAIGGGTPWDGSAVVRPAAATRVPKVHRCPSA